MLRYQRKHTRRCKCVCHYQYVDGRAPTEEHCSTCAPYWEKKLKKLAAVSNNPRKKLIKSIDEIVSLIVRIEAGWKCVKCKKHYRPQISSKTNLPAQNMMTNSHYFSRSLWATRWDYNNMDAICVFCHEAIENHKKEDVEGFNYEQFMIGKMGTRALWDLEEKSKLECHFKEWELVQIQAQNQRRLELLLDNSGDSKLTVL